MILVIILIVTVLSVISYTKSDSNFQFQDNIISNLLIQLNNGLISVATNLESNISQILLQLDAVNSVLNSVTTIAEINTSQFNLVNGFTISNTVESRLVQEHCGDGIWHRVTYIHMCDPSQQCPSSWRQRQYSPAI